MFVWELEVYRSEDVDPLYSELFLPYPSPERIEDYLNWVSLCDPKDSKEIAECFQQPNVERCSHIESPSTFAFQRGRLKMEIAHYLSPSHLDVYNTLSEDRYFQGVVNAVVNEAEPYGLTEKALNVYFSMLSDVVDLDRVDYVEYAEMVIGMLPDLHRKL